MHVLCQPPLLDRQRRGLLASFRGYTTSLGPCLPLKMQSGRSHDALYIDLFSIKVLLDGMRTVS
jgi:hypothetical protein